MAVKFFGQFLVENGYIPRETLLEAIALQESQNKSIGEIVLELGFMSLADIDKVNLAQRNVDMRFGDLAIQMGLLSEESLQRALSRQKETHLYIGEAIVRVGGIKEEELERYLKEFKADQEKYVTEGVELPPGVPRAELWGMMADLTYKMLTRVARLNFRPEPCHLITRLEQAHIVTSMDFTGDVRCRYIISVSAEVEAKIAKAMLNQDSVDHEPVEVLQDTVMEFINVICGNIVAKANQFGASLDILPPEIIDCTGGLEIPEGYIALHFPVRLADEGEAATTIIVYP
jgi:CheY-specific phosphatase CheX